MDPTSIKHSYPQEQMSDKDEGMRFSPHAIFVHGISLQTDSVLIPGPDPDECTLAILMRSDVYPGDLPREDGRSAVLSDETSYLAIVSAAQNVWDYCGKVLRVPGWAQVAELDVRVGSQGGLAVALWATGSSMDQRYRNIPTINVPVETS
ncbi:MAG: hypothetical protein Q9173_002731 [Seirophora scorigena]